MRAARCLASASRRLLQSGAAAEAAGPVSVGRAAGASKNASRLPNRDHVFRALDWARSQQINALESTGDSANAQRAGKETSGLFQAVEQAAAAGDAGEALDALRALPDSVVGHGTVLAVRLLLASPAGEHGASSLLLEALDGPLTPKNAGGAATIIIQHRADSASGPKDTEELVSYALELRQRVELPPSAVALIIRAAGELGDGLLLRELWAALGRGAPATLGECNAFLRASLLCGDAESTELALQTIADAHGAVNGDTLVSLFSAAGSREEVRCSVLRRSLSLLLAASFPPPLLLFHFMHPFCSRILP